MKFLIAVSCLLAVASAGFVGHHNAYAYPHLAYAGAHVAYGGAQHLPVIGANGVPVDEPAVQHARAEHAAAHVEATARSGEVAYVDAHHVAGHVAYAGHVAGPVAYAAGHVYAGPQHLPVIGANGVPVDEPAVQHARAEHAASHIEAKVRNGDAAVLAHHVAGPVAYAAHVAGPVAYAAGHVYAGPQHLPVIGANGVPVDEPAVQHARAEHAASHIEAKVRNGDAAVLAHHVAGPVAYAAHHVAAPVAYAAHHYAAPVVAHTNGAVVPADTVEVAAAKAAHYAAHIEAKVRNGDIHHYAPHLVHYRKRRGVFGYGAPLAYAGAPVAHYAGHVYAGAQHLPVIGANGVPVDEPAVQHARAEHAAAHVEAAARSGEVAFVDAHHVAGHVAYAGHVAGPVAYAAGHVYAGPQHLPVIGANGVPVDEPAVQHARAEHAASHIEAKVRNGDAAVFAHHVAAPVAYAAHHYAAPVVAHTNGAVVPADTVEVAAAKAAHYAAHVEAKVRNGDIHHVPFVHAY